MNQRSGVLTEIVVLVLLFIVIIFIMRIAKDSTTKTAVENSVKNSVETTIVENFIVVDSNMTMKLEKRIISLESQLNECKNTNQTKEQK